jgi:hypothetical protein
MDKLEEKDSMQQVGDNLAENVKDETVVNAEVYEGAASGAELDCFSNKTEEELLAEAQNLVAGLTVTSAEIKEKLDSIKHNFYRLYKAKQEEHRNAFLDEGGEIADYVPLPNDNEVVLKEALAKFRELRNAEILAEEKERQDNLAAKNKILEELKALIDNSEDDFGKKVPAFQKLQQDWKQVGPVPASDVQTLWKTYQLYVETFYDNLKINNELRDYDFKKNLETKMQLCAQAEALGSEADVIGAFKKLQLLHEEWREVGPVAKEQREEIWDRFKAASTIVNKRHHDYFDQLKANEQSNLEKKTAICEKIESVDLEALQTYKDWQDRSDEIIELQGEWKKIGFAPKKDNVAIYERFRSACDRFFNAKNDFYRSSKDALVANLTKKLALCEKAEALKDSQNWREVTDKLVQMQKDWKAIGAVPKKHSDAVWKRFIAACDYFFEQKELQFKNVKDEQDKNLKVKKELIEKIKSLEIGADNNASYKELKALIAEWNEVGHVPFKDKDKVYKEYKAAIDEKFDKLNLDKANARMSAFKSNIENMADKGSERKRLQRLVEKLKKEISAYENNIGFFSNSKSSEGMVKDLERKIVKLKEEQSEAEAKLALLDEAAE